MSIEQSASINQFISWQPWRDNQSGVWRGVAASAAMQSHHGMAAIGGMAAVEENEMEEA